MTQPESECPYCLAGVVKVDTIGIPAMQEPCAVCRPLGFAEAQAHSMCRECGLPAGTTSGPFCMTCGRTNGGPT